MDPVLLSLVGLVILIFFLLVITLALWVRSVTRKNREHREDIAILKFRLQGANGDPQEPTTLINNLVDFALAFYERNRARGKSRVELANENMKSCWERLPYGFQKRLALLGGLSNLKVSDNLSR